MWLSVGLSLQVALLRKASAYANFEERNTTPDKHTII